VVSSGRAILGIGAGWFQLEHESLGFEFGTFTDRFIRLQEALQIIVPMLAGERPTFHGSRYRVREAINEPRLRESTPVMIGGSGENKTFRLAARFADHMNIICDVVDLPRKVAVLRKRCEEIGRDPATLATSYLVTGLVGQTGQEVKQIGDMIPRGPARPGFLGTVDQVAEQVHEKVLGVGITGIAISLVVNGHQPGVVSQVGAALEPLVAAHLA
jgi:alkanesulfonate monooxygenase SsuD/methylene tetrahydromethanopterin reductase-like flavin-dependent oxidoreductase (luciferase family)